MKPRRSKGISISDDDRRDRLHEMKSIATIHDNEDDAKVTVVRQAKIPVSFVSGVQMQSLRSRFRSIETHPKLCRIDSSLVENGVMNVVSGDPIYFVVASL